MIMKWWREHNIASGIQVIFRLLLGWTFLMGGYHKLAAGGFDASGFLKNAIANPVTGPDGNAVYGWYVAFLENFALPNIGLFNFLVPLGEFLVGLGLILGCLTTAAAFFGLIMNFSFILAGTVSSNPMDIFYGFMIIMAGANAGKFGLDRWVLPYLTKLVKKEKGTEGEVLKSA